MNELYQVTTTRFVAGIIVHNGKVIETAPILRWMTGKMLNELPIYWQGLLRKI